jgi:DNA-binding NarL/FixJ family response regulator
MSRAQPWRALPGARRPDSTRRRAVVIDDDRPLAALIAEWLESDGYEALTFNRSADASTAIKQLKPDVILLDLMLADDGETGWRIMDLLMLDRDRRDIPVILCSSTVDTIEARRPSWHPGYGISVLSKPFDGAALLRAVRSVVVDRAPAADPRSLLTPREQEVAGLVARGLSNRDIATTLVLVPGTVANHMAHIRQKLGCSNRAHMAAWAVWAGLVDDPFLFGEEFQRPAQPKSS